MEGENRVRHMDSRYGRGSMRSKVFSRSTHLRDSRHVRHPRLSVRSPEPQEPPPGRLLEGSTGRQGLMVNGLTGTITPKPVISAEQENTEISTGSRLWRETSTIRENSSPATAVFTRRVPSRARDGGGPLAASGAAVSRKGEAGWQKQKRLVCGGPELASLERGKLVPSQAPERVVSAGRRAPPPESRWVWPSTIYCHDPAELRPLPRFYFFFPPSLCPVCVFVL